MFSALRLSIVIFLTLLQFIAPLVHAHANGPVAKQGLHVPGLENFSAQQHTAQALPLDLGVNGVMVVVDSGIKQQRTALNTADQTPYFLLPQTLSFSSATARQQDTNFSPHQQAAVHHVFSTANSPRAPPTHQVPEFF
ncbi:MAG: hypothetical protein NTV43_03930 [Methylococcales bacterium]|nr:hypothetical protein [Methylococcales bacterium]